jgi:hypothetical protein
MQAMTAASDMCLQAIAIVDPTTQTNVKNITTFAGAPLLGPDGETPRK